ncbi:MAG: Fic family protein [Desulfosporosinus sp.]|nr:Fic family protein [Desulfosporosinus sp.]
MLNKENHLRDLSAVEFSKRAAYYMSELSMIHPFREGNSRSIREFIRQLAFERDYIINWSLISSEVLLEAMITAVSELVQLKLNIGASVTIMSSGHYCRAAYPNRNTSRRRRILPPPNWKSEHPLIEVGVSELIKALNY